MDPANSCLLPDDPDAIDETQQMSPPAGCYPEGYYGEKAHEVDEPSASGAEDSDNDEFRTTSVIIAGDTRIGHILPESHVLTTKGTITAASYKRIRSSSESSSASSSKSSKSSKSSRSSRSSLYSYDGKKICLNG